MRIIKNQSGVTPLAGVLLVVIVGIIGFAGYRVYQVNKEMNKDEPKQTEQPVVEQTSKQQPEFKIPEGFVEYENKELGFKFAYPEKWGKASFQKTEPNCHTGDGYPICHDRITFAGFDDRNQFVYLDENPYDPAAGDYAEKVYAKEENFILFGSYNLVNGGYELNGYAKSPIDGFGSIVYFEYHPFSDDQSTDNEITSLLGNKRIQQVKTLLESVSPL